jgi:hypothetical protein
MSPDDLIGTAATDQEPAPVAEAQTEPAATQPEDDPVAMLATLLERDPELTRKIADLIEQHYGGGNVNELGGVPQAAPTAAPMGAVNAQPAMPTPTPPVPSAPTVVPPELMERLNRVEQAQANLAVEKELEEARKEYEALKEQMPILPELNDQELIQIAIDRNGLPLKDALALWAWQKMREGEGTIADRLMAAMMSKSKAKGLPAVEGKGGMVPSGETPQINSMKDARNIAKDRLRALFSAPAQ